MGELPLRSPQRPGAAAAAAARSERKAGKPAQREAAAAAAAARRSAWSRPEDAPTLGGGTMPDAARSLVALAALAAACEWPIPVVAGEPDAANTCSTECLQFISKPIPLSRLDSYRSITCRAKISVILKTKKEKYFCARGDDIWVKEIMRQIDARNAPSSSRYDTTAENLPGVGRHSGEAKEELGGQAHPTKTFSTTPYKTATLPVITTGGPNSSVEKVLAGSETSTYPTLFTPQPEAVPAKSTLQSDSIANREVVSETTEGHKRFGEHVTPPRKGLEDFARTTHLLVSPPTSLAGTDETSTSSNGFETLLRSSVPHPMNSSISKLLVDFVTIDKTAIMIPTKLSNSSDQQSLFLSSFGTDHKPQSVEGSTVQSFPASFSPRSSSDGDNLSSVKFRGVISAKGGGNTTETTLAIETGTLGSTFSKTSDALPFSDYDQETFNEESTSVTITNTPQVPFDVFPFFQSKLQNYVIPVVSIGGVLCVILAIGGLLYVKRGTCTRQSPTRQVQGLMYFPCDSQTELHPMEIL
ncbi:fractalkine [Candoia aspera]|uniref:fractalkine n=1 Tax=Candoia aspera TaxID=51853 RepID=UPI002FD878FA